MKALLHIIIVLYYINFTHTAEQVTCDITEGLHLSVIRTVENQGFHRVLQTVVEITQTRTSLPPDCHIILKESFPSSLYIDPDQLQQLQSRGQYAVHVPNVVDTERPEFVSEGTTFYVYKSHVVTGNLITLFVALPIHVRYHRPTSHNKVNVGYATVSLHPPQVLLSCPSHHWQKACPNNFVQAPCHMFQMQRQCSWMDLPYKKDVSVVRLYIPVGNMDHLFIVTLITFLVAVSGTYYLVHTIKSCQI